MKLAINHAFQLLESVVLKRNLEQESMFVFPLKKKRMNNDDLVVIY